MLLQRRLGGRSGTSLLVLSLLCLQPESVICQKKCSVSGSCPGRYLCCYNQHCCPLSQRVAELAGAVSGLFLVMGGMAFCCIQCCRTRRRDRSIAVVRVSGAVATPAPSSGSSVDHFTETSPLTGAEHVTYGSGQDVS